jgi:hypothetical protein
MEAKLWHLRNLSMKVYNVGGYNYKDTPTIILKGDWLKETGFEIGSLIQVKCKNGKLIITPRRGRGGVSYALWQVRAGGGRL